VIEHRLDYLFNLQMGKTPARATNAYWNDGANYWVAIADLSRFDKYVGKTKETISDLAVSESGIRSIPKNTVIMSFKLSLGKVAITTEPTYTNEAIMGFIDKGVVEVSPDYIYFLFDSMDWNEGTNKAVKGATLNKTTLSARKIPLPKIETQQRIANILDKAQALIAIRKEQIAVLDKLAKDLFVDMFGDPVENPMGWEVKPLGEKCNIITGNTPSRSRAEYYGSYIEWIKSDNINTGNTYLTQASEYLSEKGVEKGRTAGENAILMTCIAGSLHCIGNVAISDRTVAFNQQINAIESNDEVDVFFLFYLFTLTKTSIQNEVNKSMKGILNKGKLSAKEFIFPPIKLQQKFADRAESINIQKSRLTESLAELESLYKSLTQRAFARELFE
jgi:type I restriction enzyme S subunit